MDVIQYVSVRPGVARTGSGPVMRQELDLIDADADDIHGLDTVITADGTVRTELVTAPTYAPAS